MGMCAAVRIPDGHSVWSKEDARALDDYVRRSVRLVMERIRPVLAPDAKPNNAPLGDE